MKHTAIGILAHVDAGKTSMAEAMLYETGAIKTLGRVDHQDAFLDTQRLERRRGITIFSKQAIFDLGDTRVTLLDTPGHMDFSAEMERVLSVLDYAILVISGPDGVQAHTATVWALLKRYQVPAFLWVNKMDLAEASRGPEARAEILQLLQGKLSAHCIDMQAADAAESMALTDEAALEEYLADGKLPQQTVRRLVRERKIFPCWFGTALKLEGVRDFLDGMADCIEEKQWPDDTRGRIFKITRADDGQRLTWLRLTGGRLKVRAELEGEKISQIRVYNGTKYETVDAVEPGQVVALCGPADTYAGQAIGKEKEARKPLLEPVLSYRISPTDGTDAHTALQKLSQLAEEDPMLRIVWEPRLQEIQAQLMGEVQIEVLEQIIEDRFGMSVSIDSGRILYKETIEEPVEGVGHFEPLRHYAEVHLLMEPLPEGSGILLESLCHVDDLDLNWQRLILTNLAEKTHLGVLTGSPITDMKISVVAGRAHLKHTEGGDFRQATYRAVRQGLMQAKNVLLEPWYRFRLEVPPECIGRAIGDIKAMHAEFEGPSDCVDSLLLTGTAPVSEMQDYQKELMSYTKGRGRLTCRFEGYFPCHNTAKVVEEVGYDATRDADNPADSVFCSHGAGVNVKWDKVKDFMHVDSGLRVLDGEVVEESSPKVRTGKSLDLDERALEEIMAREFGPIKRPVYSAVTRGEKAAKDAKRREVLKDYLIVDGYNVIFAWDELKELAKSSFAGARERLTQMLVNYHGYRGGELVLVFDGYKVKGNPGSKEETGGIHIVYTKENESADNYIESLVHEIGKNYRVRVATSDGLIQLTALRMGVQRMSARELEHEVRKVLDEIAEVLENQERGGYKLGDLVGLEP
ncbi:MAG: NYN domain-containing protein [Firmicutes bacterium]|nr:NYN domain-containing protein [Bacillota bacterium]